MGDLVARLRELAEALEGCEWEVPLCARETCLQAAEDSTRLHEQLANGRKVVLRLLECRDDT